MKLLLLTPLVVFVCLAAQLKTCKAAYRQPPQKSIVLDAGEVYPFNPFLLFI